MRLDFIYLYYLIFKILPQRPSAINLRGLSVSLGSMLNLRNPPNNADNFSFGNIMKEKF